MPSIIDELVDDVTDGASQRWNAVKSGKKAAFNVIGQAKKLFQIRSLLNSAGDVFEQYISIGPLINPFYLLLAVLSLIGLLLLMIVGGVLAIITLI
jgi:hypothetical protein